MEAKELKEKASSSQIENQEIISSSGKKKREKKELPHTPLQNKLGRKHMISTPYR